MKKLTEKLKSTHGVTLLLTVVFMLFCVFVGGSVLAAATSNGARVEKKAEKEQTYLSLRSAALVIIGNLRGADGSTPAMTVTMKTPTDPNAIVVSSPTDPSAVAQLLYFCTLTRFIPDGLTAEQINNHLNTEFFWNIGNLTNLANGFQNSGYADFDVRMSFEEGTDTCHARLELTPGLGACIYFVDSEGNVIPDLHIEMKVAGYTESSVYWNAPTIVKGE